MAERTCTINGCANKRTARGWCATHYGRWRKHGDPNVVARVVIRRESAVCAIEGCDAERTQRDWCRTHYFRWYRNGDPERLVLDERRAQRPTACGIEGCDKPPHGIGLCSMHAARFYRHGDPQAVTLRPNWRGDEVGYRGVHTRLAKVQGKAERHGCAHCGGQASQWAYDHGDPNEKYSPRGLPYSTDLKHYMALCVPCHHALDH